MHNIDPQTTPPHGESKSTRAHILNRMDRFFNGQCWLWSSNFEFGQTINITSVSNEDSVLTAVKRQRRAFKEFVNVLTKLIVIFFIGFVSLQRYGWIDLILTKLTSTTAGWIFCIGSTSCYTDCISVDVNQRERWRYENRTWSLLQQIRLKQSSSFLIIAIVISRWIFGY